MYLKTMVCGYQGIRVITHCVPAVTRITKAGFCSSITKLADTKQQLLCPKQTLVDEPIHIKASGLKGNEKVTIACSLNEGGIGFSSRAHYVTDQFGNLDLSRHSSVGGTYRGVHPMGLLWSMVADEDKHSGKRLLKKDISTPFKIDMSLYYGHLDPAMDCGAKDGIAHQTIERWYIKEGVKRIPIRDGRVRGTLFLPQEGGPFPGIIDMFGITGGLVELRAALLASRGFATLALAYFGYDDLPATAELDLKYFEEAADWFSSHPSVLGSGIGTLGVSKGGELALYMATACNSVKAAVAINSYHVYTSAVHTKDGKTLPTLFPKWERVFETDEGYVYGKAFNFEDDKDLEKYYIPIQNAKQAQLLLISGGDDQICAVHNIQRLEERLRSHGCHNYKCIVYGGAGHIIEPPFTPLCRMAYHKTVSHNVVNGGHLYEHANAQEQSWKEIVNFFKANLPS